MGIKRRVEGRIAAGLAGGIADRLGVSAIYVRAAFVILSLVWGFGILLYLGGWAATIDQTGGVTPFHENPTPMQRMGLVMSFCGALVFLLAVLPWPGGGLVWPIAIGVGVGAFVVDRWEWLVRLDGLKTSRVRLIVGVGLVVGGVALLGDVNPSLVAPALVAVLITAAGIAVVVGPWLYGAIQDLSDERRERIRQEEKAEMASHLHDSVLQTLAMIQRTDDHKRVVTLARAQERQLRRWLFGVGEETAEVTLGGALQGVADRVEGDFDVAVEVVKVGDADLDDRLLALVSAGGEAITNAAKHAGVDTISVFLEVTDSMVELFVTDQGRGFERSSVPADRRGIEDSILRRMARHGGSVVIDARPGEGTEIHLTMERSAR